jgi:hypothetical protein
MHPGKGQITNLLLILSGLFIPVNIYVIGNWMGAGVQFALFRVQWATRWSYISLFRDIQFVANGTLSGKTAAGILFWAGSATVLAFAAFLYIFQKEIRVSGRDLYKASFYKAIGLSILGSAVLFLLSMVAQYGPLFHGPPGFVIPVGLPVMFYSGYYFYCLSSSSGPIPPDGIAAVFKSWGSLMRNPRIIYALVCFFAIFFSLNYILYVYPDAGSDFGTYCSAVDLWTHGENPYNMEKISQAKLQFVSFGKPGTMDTFLYPPATLLFFAPACDALNLVYPFKIFYPIYLLIFLTGCLVAVRLALPENDRLLLYSLLTAGFGTLFWSFASGNISILYFLFIPLVFYFLIKNRYYASSLCMGLMAIFNLFPIVFSSLYVFIGKSRKEKVKVISASVVILLSSLGLSYFVFPTLFNSYAMQFLGRSSPIYETGGYKTPTAYLFFRDVCELVIGKNTLLPYLMDLGFICALLVIFYFFYKANRIETLRLFSFGLITIFLLIPRLKPNYFIFILIPIYLLTIHERDLIKTLIVVIGAIIPSICIVVRDHLQLAYLSEGPISLLISYNLLLCALALFILISWLGLKERVGRGTGSFPCP